MSAFGGKAVIDWCREDSPLLTDAVDKTFFEARVSNINSRPQDRFKKPDNLDSIIANALTIADFIDSIDPKRT
jgi:hypothetical protein